MKTHGVRRDFMRSPKCKFKRNIDKSCIKLSRRISAKYLFLKRNCLQLLQILIGQIKNCIVQSVYVRIKMLPDQHSHHRCIQTFKLKCVTRAICLFKRIVHFRIWCLNQVWTQPEINSKSLKSSKIH
jgi:hypothetical protein